MDSIEGQNVYQMIVDASSGGGDDWQHRWPIIVKRNSWATGIAEVIACDPQFAQWDSAKAPYYGNPKVFMLVKYRQGAPYQLEELTSPGTYGYARLAEAPGWWRRGLSYPIVGSFSRRVLTLTDAGNFSISD